MLISRADLRFDFEGAAFDLTRASDRKVVGWIVNQFLYGEVTGIQCGYWLYRAPSIAAAGFLARQAQEELSHVRRFLRVLSILGEKPERPHPAVRFLATGMMGGSWGEHVCMEMALGEGLVLSVFLLLVETVRHPEITKILESSVPEEEGHVEFGERETREWLARHPEDRKFLLAQIVLQHLALRAIRGFVERKVAAVLGRDHPVMRKFPAFYDHAVEKAGARVVALGISEVPPAALVGWRKAGLLLLLPGMKLIRKFGRRFTGRERLLTATYLEDPVVRAESARNAKAPDSV